MSWEGAPGGMGWTAGHTNPMLRGCPGACYSASTSLALPVCTGGSVLGLQGCRENTWSVGRIVPKTQQSVQRGTVS